MNLFLLYFGAAVSLASAATTDQNDPDCVIDKSKPAEGDNYYLCPEEGENTKCCTVSGEIGCCPPDESGEDMNKIYIILGCITGGLLLIVFFWKCCNTKSMPCLKKLKERFKKCCRCLDRDKETPLKLPSELRDNRFNDDGFFGNDAVLPVVEEDGELKGQRKAMELIAGKPPIDMDGEHLNHKSEHVVVEDKLGIDEGEIQPTELPSHAHTQGNANSSATAHGDPALGNGTERQLEKSPHSSPKSARSLKSVRKEK